MHDVVDGTNRRDRVVRGGRRLEEREQVNGEDGNGEGGGEEILNDMNTHCSTHVDAPYHSGNIIEWRKLAAKHARGIQRPAHIDAPRAGVPQAQSGSGGMET